MREAVSSSDISVHCGDIIREDVVEGFLAAAKKGIIVEGIEIGITHPAWGGPEFPPDELFKDFNTKPDVILFGHTHEPLNSHIEGTLFVNPGQGYKSFMVDGTMAMLTINGKEITAEIITVEKGKP